ncbi:MAG: hypothetical protein OXG39_17975 [Chloroflexi bacterium]|nr:hypothetical protein [Chloroflexota bacterium]
MATHTKAENTVVLDMVTMHGEKIATLEANYAHAATKADISDMKTELEKLKADLTWRIVIAMGAMTAVFTFIVEQRLGSG